LPSDVEELVPELVATVDAVILSGGSDVSPECYGESPEDPRWAGQPRRDEFEIALAKGTLDTGKRLLGICRGLQVVNVALGGSLWQDLVTMRAGSEVHRSQELYDGLLHDVAVTDDTLLSNLIGGGRQRVNSVHHQGIKRLADGLEIWAEATEDGVVESFGSAAIPHLLGVQWHPEWMSGDPGAEAIFRWLTLGEGNPG
jgi:putative glutamine amidotransferase